MSMETPNKENLIRVNPLALLPTALLSGDALARGGYGSPPDLPDWITYLILGIVAVFAMVVSANSSIKNWRDGNHLKSIISSAGLATVVWLIYFLINWETLWKRLTSLAIFVSAAGGALIALVAAVFILGFVLKSLATIFFKELRNVPAEKFVTGIISLVGGVIGVVFMWVTMLAFLIGIPAVIVMKVFELIR